MVQFNPVTRVLVILVDNNGINMNHIENPSILNNTESSAITHGVPHAHKRNKVKPPQLKSLHIK